MNIPKFTKKLYGNLLSFRVNNVMYNITCTFLICKNKNTTTGTMYIAHMPISEFMGMKYMMQLSKTPKACGRFVITTNVGTLF